MNKIVIFDCDGVLVDSEIILKAPKKLPFTWTAEKMGNRMVDFALSNNSYYEPIFFYKILCRLLRALPNKYTMKFLGSLK